MSRIIRDYALILVAFIAMLGILGGGALYLQREDAPRPVAALASTPVSVAQNDVLVDASWLALHRDSNESDIVIIDVSDRQQYDRGHIPGAIHIAWQDGMNLNGAGYGEAYSLTADVPHSPVIGATVDQLIVVYDNSASKHASRFVWQLRTSGYPNAVVLDGGLPAWKGAQQPVSDAITTPAPVATPEEYWDADAEITIDQLTDWIDDPNLIIIDSRNDEQKADTINDTVHIGQIPGARSLSAAAVMREDGTFASPAELEEILSPLNLSPENVIVVYGRFGIETGQVWLAFRLAGYEDVRVLDDGWIAWGFNEDLPIEPVTTPAP